MKINAISIDGFGIFHNFHLSDLPPGLIVVRGDNEAGKSTLLGFIRCMLFGFPQRETNYPPSNGGQHGGRLQLQTRNGDAYVLERHAGRRGGPVSLLMPDGRNGSDEELGRLLAGATRELYHSIYAFGLGDLQFVRTVDSVRNSIYAASAGTGAVSPTQVLKSLEQALGKIFLPGGQNPLVNAKLRELETIRGHLRHARGGIEEYDATYAELERIDVALQSLRGQIAEKNTAQSTVSVYLKVWPDWIRLLSDEEALGQLPVIPRYPDDGLHRLEIQLNSHDTLKNEINSLERRIHELARQIMELVVDENRLQQAEAIELLAERKENYIEVLSSALPLKAQKREENAAAIKRCLESLGKDWDEERVRGIDRSLFNRETTRQWQERLEHAERAQSHCAHALVHRQDALKQAQEEEKIARDKCESFGDLEVDVDAEVLKRLQGAREQFLAIIHDLPEVQENLRSTRESARQLIRDINPGWSEGDLDCFDASLVAQQRIQQFDTQFAGRQDQLTTARHKAEASRSILSDCQSHQIEIEQRIGNLPDRPNSSRQVLLEQSQRAQSLRDTQNALETNRIQSDHCRQRLEDKQHELRRLEATDTATSDTISVKTLLAGGLAAIVVGLILLFTVSRSAGVSLCLVGALLAAFSLWIGLGARRKAAQQLQSLSFREQAISDLRNQIRQLEAETNQLTELATGIRGSISELADALSLAPDVSTRELQDFEERLREDIQTVDQLERLEHELKQAQQKTTTAEQNLAQARELVRQREQELDDVQQQWSTYLDALGLARDLVPRTATLVASRVERAREQLKAACDLADRLERMQGTRSQYRAWAMSIPSLALTGDEQDTEIVAKIDAIVEQLHRLENTRKERHATQIVLSDRQKQVESAQKAMDAAQAEFDSAHYQLEQDLREWESWLNEQGLRDQLSPQTVLMAFGPIEECLRLIEARQTVLKEMAEMENGVEAYEARVRSVAQALQISPPARDRIPLVVAEWLNGLRVDQQNRTRCNEKQEQMEGLKADLRDKKADLESCEQQIRELLAAADAGDQETFRERGRGYEERQRLTKSIAELLMTIRTITGEIDDDRLRSFLSDTSKERLQAESDSLSQQLQQMKLDKEGLLQKRAELSERISGMKTADDIARLRANEEHVLAEIQEHAREWARQVLALHLLQKAREVFEKEQQPEVIREAGKFLKQLTNERYTEVLAPVGEQTLEVADSRGARKKPGELSRGTEEQLYLAIRFGYIRHRSRDTETLPVVMDDILVNFDPTRAAGAVKAILDLSKEQQILYFTCHEQTVNLFQSVDADVRIQGLDVQNPVMIEHS